MATGLQKYSTDGDPLWGFQYGAAADDYTNSMVLAPDGSYVVCGYSYAAKDNPLWGSHMFNRKHDQTGGIVWRNDFESSGVDYGMGIDNTPDGGFILCGKKDPPGEDDDAWLLKANSQGQKEWEKFFGNPGALETASSVRSVPSGGYILCGSWYPGIIAMNGSVYIVKTDASGILEWSKKFGGSGNDYGVSVDHTSDGGYIVLGVTDSFSQVTGDRDLWLLRLNSLGDTVWTKRFGGQFEEGGGSVIQTADGGFLVCGYTRSYGHGGADVYLIKTNENGVVTSTSEARTDKHEFIVFPNPTKGAITITAPLKSNGYEITDITGRVICSLPGTESLQPVTIDLGNKNEGLYFITVFTETGSVCKKIIKTN
jgi:hypothetical protein